MNLLLPQPGRQYDFTNEAQTRSAIESADKQNWKRTELTILGPETVPYNASDFSTSGSMTWTVEPGDVYLFWYTIIGKLMTVSFFVSGSSIGGTLSDLLLVKIPAGKLPAQPAFSPCMLFDNSGPWQAGHARVQTGNNAIALFKQNGASWTASTNQTYVYAQISFPVQ